MRSQSTRMRLATQRKLFGPVTQYTSLATGARGDDGRRIRRLWERDRAGRPTGALDSSAALLC